MMNFLSKTESKRKPKLDDSFEVKGSLRSLIHSQTNPKFKEVIKNSEKEKAKPLRFKRYLNLIRTLARKELISLIHLSRN